MRIAVNARFLHQHTYQGIGRYTLEILRRMIVDHPSDHFVLLYDRPYRSDLEKYDNVTARVVRPVTRHPILWYIWFEWRVPSVLGQIEADCFLSFDSYASTRTNVPTVIISHDIAYHHYPEHLRTSHLMWYRRWFPRYHRRADQIVAVSQYTADDIISTYRLDPEKVTVGYNACPDHFAPISDQQAQALRDDLTGGTPFFVYIGSLHPRKNIVRLIEAFELYRSRGGSHKLVLIGRLTWKTTEIEDKMQNSPCAKDIVHLSQVGDEAAKILAAAEALVYVSLFEGFGIPLLEAMAAHVPVITSSVSSMPEVAGSAGLIVDPHQAESIADAMVSLSTSKGLRQQLIEAGRSRVLQFDWSKSSNVVYQACRKAIQQNK